MRRFLPEHFRLFLLFGLITSTLLFGGNAVAAESEFDTRPTVGLVLSGGGARGAAHVGVIKVLDELQIPIDYIAGTSMGAIVAGLYASVMMFSRNTNERCDPNGLPRAFSICPRIQLEPQ